ncbi:hypothetical protein, partial [Veronia nyctiphanis]|uniref:hypothetical protein n=1 Tax=Veronia nyctiphanis TaxID=1278244 RepID=UPI001F1AB228
EFTFRLLSLGGLNTVCDKAKCGSFFERCWRQAATNMEQGLTNAATGQKTAPQFFACAGRR